MGFLGIDPIHDMIPVRAVAHYSMGGIEADINGRTRVENIWAAGEAACHSLHGANRLGTNSTAECLVWGGFTGKEALDYVQGGADLSPVSADQVKAEEARIFEDIMKRKGSENPYEIRRELLLMPRDPETLKRDVREMRERMRRELGSGASDPTGKFDLKQDAGGIADIEFMVQYAALRWAARLGDYLDFTDNIRLLEGIADARLMETRDVELLTDAYRAYRARVHALALQEETTVKSDGDFDHYRQGVVAIWQALMED